MILHQLTIQSAYHFLYTYIGLKNNRTSGGAFQLFVCGFIDCGLFLILYGIKISVLCIILIVRIIQNIYNKFKKKPNSYFKMIRVALFFMIWKASTSLI